MKEVISWLFKDPIVTMVWPNVDHSQSNSKKSPKKFELPQMNFFSWKTTNKIFTVLLALFILQNFEKNSYSWSRVMRISHFPFALKFFFCYKPILLLSSIYWPFALCKILRFLQQNQCSEDAPFLGPKWPIYPNDIFFAKLNKPWSFHSCLSTSQKSKSDFNLLMKYWRLKNTEIILGKSHFWL